MASFALFLLRYRIGLSAVFAAALLASAVLLPRVQIDLSIIPLLEANQTARDEVLEFEGRFPQDGVDIPIVLEWPETIGQAELEELARLGRSIETLPHASTVASLATTRVVSERDGRPQVDLFLEVQRGRSALERVANHPLLAGTLLSRDGRSAALLVTSDLEAGVPERGEFLAAVEALLAEETDFPVRVHVLGGTIVERTMNGHIRRDMVQSILIETLFFVFLLPILFRTLRGMVLPLFVVGSAVVLNFGFMAISGRAITSLGIAIPGLIVIIALCDAIHMMHRFEEAFSRTGDKFGSIVEMMKNVGQACVYTSLTTALGFFSLVVARHAAVRDFAVSITIGVGFAFITVIAVLPLALSFWPVRRPKPGGLAVLDRLSYGKLRLTLGVFGLVLALSAIGISRVVVDSSWLGELPANDPVVQDLVWYESNFQGLLTLEAEVEGALDTYEAFQAVERLRDRMLREEGITGAETYADWIHEMAGHPVDGDKIDEATWARALALLRLTGDAFPRHIVTPEFSHARLILRTRDLGTKRYLELQDTLAREAAGIADGLHARTAGYSQMAHESNQLVVTTMAQSLAVSLAAISLFIALAYRSVRLAIISIVPNLLPIVVALGVSGWFGIHMRIGVLMVFCAGIGLAVDDSIHLITRFLEERRAAPDVSIGEHLHRSLRSTGKALVITTAVLAAGALSFLPSSFQSMSDVGVLLTTIVVSALIADLFVFPHLLERFLPQTVAETAAAGHGSSSDPRR